MFWELQKTNREANCTEKDEVGHRRCTFGPTVGPRSLDLFQWLGPTTVTLSATLLADGEEGHPLLPTPIGRRPDFPAGPTAELSPSPLPNGTAAIIPRL